MQKPWSGSGLQPQAAPCNMARIHFVWPYVKNFLSAVQIPRVLYQVFFEAQVKSRKSWGTVHLERARENLWLHEPFTKHRAHGPHCPCSMHDTKGRVLWTEQASLYHRTWFFLKRVWELVLISRGFWKYSHDWICVGVYFTLNFQFWPLQTLKRWYFKAFQCTGSTWNHSPKEILACIYLNHLFILASISIYLPTSPHLQTEELEDLAGNSMNIRACAAAWLCLFSALDLTKWNREAITAESTEPLLHDVYWWVERWKKMLGCCLASQNFSGLIFTLLVGFCLQLFWGIKSCFPGNTFQYKSNFNKVYPQKSWVYKPWMCHQNLWELSPQAMGIWVGLQIYGYILKLHLGRSSNLYG